MATSMDPSAAPAKGTFEVQVAGLRVPLRSMGPDTALAREVARLVSERIAEAEKRIKTGAAAHQVALLALMDLGEEYLLARKRTEEFRKSVEEQTRALVERIEQLERAATSSGHLKK